MGDVNLEIKLSNLDERVIKIEESGGGSGGDGYITSVSNDFNVINKKLSLSNDVTTKLSKVDNKIDKPTSATEGQVLTYRNNEWVADDSQGGGQFVIIAKGENYEGQTVTATKGTKSKSAVITSGVARITVDEGGVWTLTLSSGKTFNTPNMTYYGEYEVALAPNGATVTPTDDVQTWLHCANVWDKSYITISEVVADTTTLNTLIANENANDYLVRSTTFATDICNNESAMTYIGLNDYCANTLLSNSTWSEAICNAKDSSGNDLFEKVLNVKVPTLISNTSSDGGEAFCSDYYVPGNRYPWKAFDDKDATSWCNAGGATGYIGYKFPKKVCVNKLRLVSCDEAGNDIYTIKDFDIYGSDDGTNWGTPIYSGTKTSSTKLSKQDFNINNNKSYLYYKVQAKSTYSSLNDYVTIGTVQFYGREEA